tara:strand:- start:352 stop:678 length:327 start_codon:yes stop_codon:yes gene_type:complete
MEEKKTKKMKLTPEELEYILLQVTRYGAFMHWIFANKSALRSKFGIGGTVKFDTVTAPAVIEEFLREESTLSFLGAMDKCHDENCIWDQTHAFNILASAPLDKLSKEG